MILGKTQAVKILKSYRHLINHQQFSTLKGQILAGDVDGAMRGLANIMKRRESEK